MNNTRATSSYVEFYTPPRVAPEDVAQALQHVASLLRLNDDPWIEPGELQGMSKALAHAMDTCCEMRNACPDY